MDKITDILRDKVTSKKEEIDQWFIEKFGVTKLFYYSSIDIRNAGFKLAPVDTNLFPGGFNNLSDKDRIVAASESKNFFKSFYPDVKNILLIAEDHTRNLFYLENVVVIRDILENAGFEVRVGSFYASAVGEVVSLKSKSGADLQLCPIQKEHSQIKTNDDFIPDIVIINNDLTSGAPNVIKNIEQTVIPPVGFGWYKRRKTSHFDVYNELANSLCNKIAIDPWFISTIFHKCGLLNFKEKKGVECVAIGVDKVIHKVKEKYKQYGIKETPYVFIKSDKGTYGMGIMTARSGEDVISMNKKLRNQMNKVKGGEENTEVIIQEGVPTIDIVDGKPAEPMMYFIGNKPVGCFYRYNEQKDIYGNLNASGMMFESAENNKSKETCQVLSLVAKLATYSAAWECYSDSYQI